MIEPGNLNGYLVAIKEELRKAEGKHPDFCDAMLDPESRVSWAESESRIKARNAMTKGYADNILMEEVAEAFAAYQQDDKNDLKRIEEISKEVEQRARKTPGYRYGKCNICGHNRNGFARILDGKFVCIQCLIKDEVEHRFKESK